MLRAIFAKHVKEGDEILAPGGVRISVAWTDQRGTTICIAGKDGRRSDFYEYELVGLGHRPSEDSEELLDKAVKLAEEFALKRTHSRQDADATATALRETLEAYELGKPLEKKS